MGLKEFYISYKRNGKDMTSCGFKNVGYMRHDRKNSTKYPETVSYTHLGAADNNRDSGRGNGKVYRGTHHGADRVHRKKRKGCERV